MRALHAKFRDGSDLMKEAAVTALRQHALDAHPQECLGFVDSDGDYIRLVNMAAEPELSAVPDRRELSELLAEGNIRALCHSHPGGPDCPSETDMRSQVELDIPFVIVTTNGQATAEPFAWGDGLAVETGPDNDAPLVGRPFRHGVTDCYALIRDWYALERGIELPDFPRNWEWWLDDTPGEKDLYSRYFRDAGFVEVDAADARHGDVWLAAVRSSVPNHAGIYLDAGLCLHHPSSGVAFDPARLSKRESIARWTPYLTHWLRRE